jgi:hypothetical protein
VNNQIRLDVNTWIKNTATGLSKKIDAWTAIRDPASQIMRLTSYRDPNISGHFNDAGYSAIMALL